MRILTLTNMYPTARMPQFGIFVHEQVESIRRLGCDVDVLFMNPKEGQLRRKAYFLGIPRLWKALSERPYDLIHAHYVFSGMVARSQFGTPVVLTHHGPELVHPWQGPLCRLTRSWADETIVVAPWMVPELGLGDVHVIPCGTDLRLFSPMDRIDARTRLNLDPNRRYILFAGNVWDPRKRFGLVEEAARIVASTSPDVELITVCGEPHERIPLYMSAADVFAMTSTSEGSAQVVKEAMACNLPIVATDAGDNWDVIAETPGCFRTSADPYDIAGRLAEAVSPPRRTEGRKRMERFSLDSIAHAVVAVYQKTMASRQIRPRASAARPPLNHKVRRIAESAEPATEIGGATKAAVSGDYFGAEPARSTPFP